MVLQLQVTHREAIGQENKRHRRKETGRSTTRVMTLTAVCEIRLHNSLPFLSFFGSQILNHNNAQY